MDIWDKMYKEARKIQNGRTLSPFIEAGGVAAAVLSSSGKIYVGVCIDTCSSLGMCAERNAIANMITNGEHIIEKVIAIMPDGKTGAPCGACREFMMQLGSYAKNIEIMLSYEEKESVRLGALCPEWWGYERYK
ncbi:MAG: cytidine deaminase [Ruminococcaceae bacterium]|nr:cytidine deaminase [Oscillospiraceae bacterium]